MHTGKIIDYIVQWLVEYCDNAGMKGFVVGISGGIDSAVTSTLCAKSGKSVLALNMPIYQAEGQKSLAMEHINWLEENYTHVQGVTIDLTPPFQALENTYPPDIQDELSMANTRSRLRMITLYAFATHNRMLVTGTGNKVEDFGVGFFTKYGDGGVDIAPIADLMKTEVYEIGKSLGVLPDILCAKPTDGLWMDNRSDEDQLGATYPELEWAMQFDSAGHEETGLTARQRQVLSLYRELHRKNLHKMQSLPVARIPDELR
ncbi:MAG: NAD(+) synthase [Thermodesulfobacteriota bacterium]